MRRSTGCSRPPRRTGGWRGWRRSAPRARADLHVHRTQSEGASSRAGVGDLARRSGLAAVAVTDHDTTGGVAEAVKFANDRVEVIAGVEVTAEHDGREVHLLGYFVR